MLETFKKHAWKPAAFCLMAYGIVAANGFIEKNSSIAAALINSNGDIDTACKKHLSTLRLTQGGYYATTDSMSITKTPPQINTDMETCKKTATLIKPFLTPKSPF